MYSVQDLGEDTVGEDKKKCTAFVFDINKNEIWKRSGSNLVARG